MKDSDSTAHLLLGHQHLSNGFLNEKVMHRERKNIASTVHKYVNYHGSKFGKEDYLCKFSREEVCNISGNFGYIGNPHWSFILEDESYQLPCIIINFASQVLRLFKCLKNTIFVRKGHLVIEKYKDRCEEGRLMVWLQLSLEDVYISDASLLLSVIVPPPEYWTLLILVVHVSTPIFVSEKCAFSLVLVMTSLPGSEKPIYLWIVLTGKQLLWNLFLTPNREYNLRMMVDENYLDLYIRPLRAVVGMLRGVKAIVEVLHHPELWPTLDAIDLPQNTMISLQSSLNRKMFNCKMPSAWWMSIEEALSMGEQKIVSIWGEVVRVFHDETQDKDGCSLCQLTRSKSQTSSNDFQLAESDFVNNPWETSLKIDEELSIPNLENENEKETNIKMMGTFIPEKLTKNVYLKDMKSGRTVSLYIRRWSQYLYSTVFTPGVILCARMVQKRKSSKSNVYFTTCALSSFEIIGCPSSMSKIVTSASIKFGFPQKVFFPHEKVWGILDMWNLTRVSLTHTTDTDSGFFASAVLTVDRFSGSPIRIILQDSNVRTLLNMPLEIWTQFVHLSKEKCIEFNPSILECTPKDDVDALFHAYCSMVNAEKQRFHIACRFLEKTSDDSYDLYFCTILSEADSKQLVNIDSDGKYKKEDYTLQMMTQSFIEFQVT